MLIKEVDSPRKSPVLVLLQMNGFMEQDLALLMERIVGPPIGEEDLVAANGRCLRGFVPRRGEPERHRLND